MIQSSRPLLPRWIVLVLWPMLLLLAHLGLPASLSTQGARIGWKRKAPSAWNVLGLVLIVPGLILLGWCVWLHFAHSPSRVEMAASAPPYLLTDGPYRRSRNPMYVAGMAIWAGMAVFYGSVTILIAGVLFWSAVVFLAVPYEERHLRSRLGEVYDQYSRSVPRWR